MPCRDLEGIVRGAVFKLELRGSLNKLVSCVRLPATKMMNILSGDLESVKTVDAFI